jgi:4-amino-4-deoxy-L-arabinose transferase-like glycosyltransferase
VGFGFLTKMGQALLIVPALGLVYLVAGPTRLRTRLWQLLAALGAMVVSAGWFVALVDLWPAADRPYIGGSTTNSLLELALGYNGIGRLLGGAGNGGANGGGGAGGANAGFGGATGILRLFTDEMGLEVSWLLPAALLLLVAGLWATRRAPRTDKVRAGLLLWGGWTLVTGLVFSFMSGTIHPYYTVALAPGIAGVVALGAYAVRRDRWVLALAVAVTAAWSFTLLITSSEPFAWVCWIVLAAGVVAVGALLAGGRFARLAVVAALVTGLVGTGGYALATAATAHSGSIPSVGTVATAMGGGPGGGQRPEGAPDQGERPAGGMGGAASAELTALLSATDSTWSAAVGTSQSAASLELASGTAVMSLGGWSGSDSAVTLEQFQAYVAAGQIHYYVGGGQGGGPGGQSDGTAAQIAAWVAANFTATTVGGQTVYDLS